MSPPEKSAAPGSAPAPAAAPVSVSVSVSLRRMALADLDAVMVIERAAFKHPWSPEMISSELDHLWSTVLVAEAAGEGGAAPRVVGFIIFWTVHDEVHVLNVATDPAFRHRGIGRAMLDECMARSRAAGAVVVGLEVRRSNETAIRLYEKYGFVKVGVRPRYYEDEGEDAIVMDYRL